VFLKFSDSEPLGGRLASRLSCSVGDVEVHHFPDGESRVRLPPSLPERVIMCRSLDDPNAKLVELMLAAQCARDLGARHITLVAPYLCYMRQDAAFEAGEAVSQRIIGEFLAAHFDGLVTVDPHLHRTARLEDAVPATTCRALSAAPFVGDFLASRGCTAVLLGPDAESRQWAGAVAERAGLEYAVAEKSRRGDTDVAISLPPRDWRGVEAVLVDDVAASGRTLAEAARALLAAGATRVDAVVTHALFAGDALTVMRSAGIGEVWSSDSIGHASNAFSLAPAIAAAL
jgi:ribose-phosphate pyrophosphokinase